MRGRGDCLTAWLAGALLLGHVGFSLQLEMTEIPVIAPFPPLQPSDTGYPGNIPPDLPTSLEQPPPILEQGPESNCPTTVGQILSSNQRTLLAQYLQSSPLGQQILTGRMAATILAPPDAYLQQVLASRANGLGGAQAASGIAEYHVLQGAVSMNDLAKRSGHFWNTSLAKPPCATACQVVYSQTSPVDVNSNTPVTFLRSATQTARITKGDIKACNSVVHLLDRALQPCCTSMYEFLGNFSIVQIQPSFFDGFAPLEPIQSTDRFNRRLFEEAAVDFMLYSTSGNTSRNILWPSASAWSSFSLDELLPGFGNIDVETRTRAMRILALYAMSYTHSLLPRDIPGPDGAAPAVQFPHNSALRNITAPLDVWTCSDTLTANTPALPPTGAPQLNPNFQIPGASPSPSSPASPSPNTPQNPNQQANQQQVNRNQPVNGQPGAPMQQQVNPNQPFNQQQVNPNQPVTQQPGQFNNQQQQGNLNQPVNQQPGQFNNQQQVNPNQPFNQQQNPNQPFNQQQPLNQQQPISGQQTGNLPPNQAAMDPQVLSGAADGSTLVGQVSVQGQNPNNPQLVGQGQPGVQQGRRRRRLASAVDGESKVVNVQTVYETCESTRILIVDAVAVPCDFDRLVRNYDAIDQRLSKVKEPKEYRSLAAAYYDWLVSRGVIEPGTPVSSVPSAAEGMGMGAGQRRLALILCSLLVACFIML